jgi:hypothetical protein
MKEKKRDEIEILNQFLLLPFNKLFFTVSFCILL